MNRFASTLLREVRQLLRSRWAEQRRRGRGGKSRLDWRSIEPLEARVMLTTVTGVSSLSAQATIAVGAGDVPGTNAVRLVSQGPLPYDGSNSSTWSTVNWVPQTPFTLSQLTTLSASFKGEVGTLGGGSLRFSIFFDWNNNGVLDTDPVTGIDEINGRDHMFVIWGTDSKAFRDVPSYTIYTDTANFVTTTNHNWDVSQLVPRTTYPYRTLSDALAQISDRPGNPSVNTLIGGLRVLQISLVDDGGWSQTNPVTTPALTQQFLVDHILIEGFVPSLGGASLAAASDLSASTVTPNFSELLVATVVPTPGPNIAQLIGTDVTRPDSLTLTTSGVVDPAGKTVTAAQFFRDSNNNGLFDVSTDQLLGAGTPTGSDWTWTGSSISFAPGLTKFFVRAQNSQGTWGPVTSTNLTVSDPVAGPNTVTGVTSFSSNTSIVPGAGQVPGTDAVRLLSQGPLPYDGNPGSGFGSGVSWTPQSVITFSQVLTLSATFKGEIGTFGGGGPRFSIYFDWNGNGILDTDPITGIDEANGRDHMFVIWGTDSKSFRDVPSYTDYADTGNFVTSTSKNWDISQLSSGIYPYRTYSDALAQPSDRTGHPTVGQLIGNLRVLKIGLVLDGGWSMGNTTTPANTQQFLIDHVLIEGFTPTIASAGVGVAATPGVFTENLVATTVPLLGPAVGSLVPSPDPVSRPGNLTLTASSIVDPFGNPVTTTEFYRDTNGNGSLQIGVDQLLGSDTDGTDGWSWSGSTAGFNTGGNTYFARAKNSLGGWGVATAAVGVVNNAIPSISTLTASPAPAVKGVNELLTAGGVIDPDGVVSLVEFYRDANNNGVIDPGTDVLLGTDGDGSDGWSLSADTSGFPSGPVRFLARAQDNDSAWSNAASITGTVDAPPVVGNLAGSPSPVLNRGDTFILTATGVSDPDGTVASVTFYRDANGNGFWDAADAVLGTDTNASNGWAWNGSSSAFPTGNVAFFARAKDNAGVFTINPAATTVLVNAKPTVGGLAVSPSPVLLNDNVTLTATTVVDTDGTVGKVEFYRDVNGNGAIDAGDVWLGDDTNSAGGWSITVSTASFPLGTVKYLTRAQDNLNAWGPLRSGSGVVNLAPLIASLAGAPDPVNKGDNFTLTASGVSDPNGTVVSVTFYRDSNNSGAWESTDSVLGTDTNASNGWSWTGATSAFPIGVGRFFARAKDNNGSYNVNPAVTTALINAKPTVGSLAVSPNPVILGNNVTLTASSVADADGTVGQVEFYRDVNGNSLLDLGTDVLLGADADGTNGWSLIVSTAGFPLGTNTFLARAQDNLGAWGAAKTATGVVNVPPTIASLIASADPVLKGDNLVLTALGVADAAPGTVASVTFYRDSNNNGILDSTDSTVGTDTNGSDGWSVIAATTTYALGPMRFFAVAKDNNKALSAPATTTTTIVATLAPASSGLASTLQPVDLLTGLIQLGTV